MSKLSGVVACGLAVVLLAACERSSAVATRAQGTDRHALYQDSESAGPASEAAPNSEPRDRAENKTPEPVREINGKPIWSSSRKGSAEENAERSFARNGEDFGAQDLDSYIKKAQAFVAHPPGGAQTLTRVNGDVLIYDAKSNGFAVAPKDGTPILGWWIDECMIVDWRVERWGATHDGEDMFLPEPTHWMPLPEPPRDL